MVNTACCVVNCPTGLKSERKKRKLNNERHVALFSVPVDEELFQVWKTRIPVKQRKLKRKDQVNNVSVSERELTHADKVCELHFNENDIQKHWTYELSDGSVSKVKKKKYSLKNGAVPMFTTSERKSDLQDPDISKKQHDEHELPAKTITTMESLTFKVGTIKVPNPWWGIICTPKFIVCTKWNSSGVCEKKVLIGDDLQVKIFMMDVEIFESEKIKLSSLATLSELLLKVDGFKICLGIENMDHSLKRLCQRKKNIDLNKTTAFLLSS